MDKPNIVWIYRDELMSDALSCYAHNIACHSANRDIVRQLSEMLDQHAEGRVEPPHDYVRRQ